MKHPTNLNPDATPSGPGVPPVNPETDAEKITRLESELAAARAAIARYETADSDRAETEKIVRAKMALGLTRQQALSVIERQKAHNAAEQKRKAESATAEPQTVPVRAANATRKK